MKIKFVVLVALLIVTFLVVLGRPKVSKKYTGTMVDACSQWRTNAYDLDFLMSIVKKSGVDKIYIATRIHSKHNFEPQRELGVNRKLKDYSAIAIASSPKYFRSKEDLKSVRIDLAVGSMKEYKYPYFSEVMYRHADKDTETFEPQETMEKFIPPFGQWSQELLRKIEKLNVPIFIHWEFYKWDDDYPEFAKLFSAHPHQIFIISHMGFGSAEQMDYILSRHKNVYATISKRDKHFDYFLDKSISQGSNLVDDQMVLRPEWRELFTKYPDRLLFAIDAHLMYMWQDYGNIVERYRLILGQLPEADAKKIAFENASRLFEKK